MVSTCSSVSGGIARMAARMVARSMSVRVGGSVAVWVAGGSTSG